MAFTTTQNDKNTIIIDDGTYPYTLTGNVGFKKVSDSACAFYKDNGDIIQLPADDDKVLMWLGQGASRIPFVDITSGGNIRINDFTPDGTASEDVTNEHTRLTLESGALVRQ